jgi:hypothetical protein
MTTAFGSIKDTFYIPAVLNESDILKKDDRYKVRYEVIGTLNTKLNYNATSLTTGKTISDIKIKSSKTNIPLLGVTLGIDQSWLDQRVAQASDWSVTHALHLNFKNRQIYSKHTTILERKGWKKKSWNTESYTSKIGEVTRIVPGSYGWSPESAKQTIQQLLKLLRKESNRLASSPTSKFSAKKYTKDFKVVYGVIEFGAEHGGIHCHLLVNLHPEITQEWIQELWKEEGTAVLYDIREKESFGVPRTSSKVSREKAVKYVVSRVLQYEGIGAKDWSHVLGTDISSNDYDTKLVIADIPSHKIPERYWGKIEGLHRFRKQT